MTDATAYLRERLAMPPRVFLILGSGLGALADEFEQAVSIPFQEIPGFPEATVAGHSGRVVCGTLAGVPCLALHGRYHLYEGHTLDTVVQPVRVAADLGVQIMIVSNAAGGLKHSFRTGDLMVIDDHINLLYRSPLIGPVQPGETRFPDMSEPYDRELQALAFRVAAQRGLRVVQGTYLACSGPSYETPAEIRMYQRMGADAVGMSTVPEVLVARARGLRVLGISLITNMASGYSPGVISHEDVLRAGREASDRFASLMRGVLAELQ
ncbi:MAG: purine-nucleoside phosphorylase [Pseudomonas sp.]